MTSTTSDPMLGNVLDGRYEILSRLARGGMATVYRAWDRRLERVVAVKIMHDGLGDDADFAKKFDREARAAAKLINPNVVGIYDQGQDQGRPYIVMEFIEGHTLRKVIVTEGPLSPLRALQYMEPIAAALAAAHEAGIVHRDVKPENVLIRGGGSHDIGSIKVADFGLAKSVTSHSSTATQGLLIGTVSYLPPELVVSGRADSRSDVYSAGIILFELLTGSKPYSGDTPIQVAYAHVNQDMPAPSQRLYQDHPQLARRQPIPDYLDALVLACTRRDAGLRPIDGHALLSRIRRARRALEQGVTNDEALSAIMFPQRHSMPSASQPSASRQPTSTAPAKAAPGGRRLRDLAGANAAATGVGTLASRTPAAAEEENAASPTQADDELTPLEVAEARDEDTYRDEDHLDDYDEYAAEFDEASEPGRRSIGLRTAGATMVAAPKTRVRRGPVLWIALAVVLAVLAGSIWWFTAGRYTVTPQIAGLAKQDAVAAAEAAGLQISFTEAYSEDVAAGHVIKSDPADGQRIVRQGTIKADLSRGPERYPMPDIYGKPLDQAKAALEQNHLRLGEVKEAYHPTGAQGTIIETSVGAGQLVAPNTAVNVVVSKGRQPIDVPNLVGMTSGEATQALTERGLVPKLSEANSKEVAAGRVISQDPASGQLFAGDTVNLTVSVGPRKIEVPRVSGQKISDATTALERAGFKVRVEYATELRSRLGLAVETVPEAGSKADEGSEVVIRAV